MKRQYKKKVKWADKIEKIMTPPELTALADLIIYQDSDGSYQLFNKYVIQKSVGAGFDVTSTVSDTCHKFFTLKNATAWCIFDKRNKFFETRRISDLDAKLGSVDIDIQIHQKMFKKAKSSDDQLIYLAKLTEDQIKKRMMTDELDRYTKESKSWQNRRFEQKPV